MPSVPRSPAPHRAAHSLKPLAFGTRRTQIYGKKQGSHTCLLSNFHIVPRLPHNLPFLDCATSWLCYLLTELPLGYATSWPSYLLAKLPHAATSWWCYLLTELPLGFVTMWLSYPTVRNFGSFQLNFLWRCSILNYICKFSIVFLIDQGSFDDNRWQRELR